MSLFLETIKIINGRRMNLPGHNMRMNKTRQDVFNVSDALDLRTIIQVPEKYCAGLVKCRVIYGKVIEKIEFSQYTFSNPRSFQLIFDDEISYDYKLLDRERLIQLFSQRNSADDIIIVKKGLITDAYYANLALKKEGIWYTPAKPLLKGTTRKRLVDKGKLVLHNITPDELLQFEELKIINAMTGWSSHPSVEISKTTIFF
jgi:4-amino-4-deoxychorismate lyase